VTSAGTAVTGTDTVWPPRPAAVRDREARRERTSPFKGLVPYSVSDADYFFGRATWRDLVIDNLLAYRVAVFYGASGIGKSSVLSAGVQYHLLNQARANYELDGTPDLVAAVYTGWGRDRERPLAGIEAALREAVAEVAPALAENPPTGTLPDILAGWSERIGGRVLLIFDQFEEYFVYEGQQRPGSDFTDELVSALNRRELEANFLISLREDSLAKLDRLEDRVPGLLDHLIRLEHLDSEGAKEAIEGAVGRWNKDHDDSVTVEPELIREVSKQVQTHRVHAGQTGHGVAEAESELSDAIEAPYLQLVLTRIWDEEGRRASKELRSSTLQELGGVDSIVETHLDQTMNVLSYNERNVAAQAFNFLVTPSGTKIAHTAADLAKYAGLEPAELQPVLAKLTGGQDRVLRAVQPAPESDEAERYEIFHDVLAPAILDWRTRFISDRSKQRNFGAAVAVLSQLVLLEFWLLLLVGFSLSGWVGATAGDVRVVFSQVWWARATRLLYHRWQRRSRRLWLVPLVGAVWSALGPVATVPIGALWFWRRRQRKKSA
jgi:hypothetical protein